MKNIKKFLAAFLVLALMLSLVACSGKSSFSLTMGIETGDKIKVKLNTTDDLSMKWDNDANVMKVSDGNSLVLSMYFADKDHIAEWVEGASGSSNVEVVSNGSGNGTKRSIIYVEAEDEDSKTANYVVAWIVGSNTGLIAQGTPSHDETKDVFEALTFSVESTDQNDEYYFLESVVMENVDNDEHPTIDENDGEEDENEEVDKTEPVSDPDEEDVEQDETEPENEGEESGKKEDGKSDKISADWKDFEFSVDGHVLSLPVSYKELKEATGLSMKSSEEKSYLEPGYYTMSQMRDEEDEGAFNIAVYNNTDEDAQYMDCIIIEISQYDSQAEDEIVALQFAGGLAVGDVTSKEELFEMFGDPVDIYEYRVDETEEGYEDWDKYETDTYTWSIDPDWDNDNMIEIEMNINTGIIEEICTNYFGEDL